MSHILLKYFYTFFPVSVQLNTIVYTWLYFEVYTKANERVSSSKFWNASLLRRINIHTNKSNLICKRSILLHIQATRIRASSASKHRSWQSKHFAAIRRKYFPKKKKKKKNRRKTKCSFYNLLFLLLSSR